MGALEAYKQSGVVQEKEWLAALDERTRDTHIEANGRWLRWMMRLLWVVDVAPAWPNRNP